MQIQEMPSAEIRVSWIYSHPSLPGTQREAHLQMEISFIHLNFPYKRITSTLFPELLLHLQLLKNNQLEIILMPKSHTLEWHILHVNQIQRPNFG